jgi:hypothetical protein
MSNFEHQQPITPLVVSERSIAMAVAAHGWANGKTRTILAFTIALLLCLAVYFFWLIWQSNPQLAEQTSSDSRRLERYNQQLAKLEAQMAGYIADSVETKLRKIEQHLTAGAVGAEEIQDFEELKREILHLQQYTAGKNGNFTDTSRVDHPRLQQTTGSQAAGTYSELIDDLMAGKVLAYLGFASCSMMALLVGGLWWQQEARVRKLMNMSPTTPLLPAPPRQEG